MPPRTAAMREASGHNAFFRRPVHVLHSPYGSRLPRASARSMVLDPTGPIYLLWVENAKLSVSGSVVQEIALSSYLIGTGWESTFTAVGRWDGEPSTEPAVAMDRHHVLHVMWLEQAESRRQVMGLRFNTVTGEMSDPIPISEAGSSAADPAVAVDPQGRVHVVWSEIEAGHPGLRHRVGDGVQWGPGGVVPTGKGASAFSPDMACDVAGVLHLAWTQATTGPNVPMYAQWTADGEWEEPERLADERPEWYTGPPVLCAAEGRVWVAWAETDGNEGRIRVRTRAHNSWSGAFSPSRAGVIAEQPSAALDPWGTLHLVWLERSNSGPTAATTTNTVVYSSCAPGNSMFAMSRSLTPTAGGLFESPMVAADSSGRVIAAWVEREQGASDIVCRHGVAGFTLPTSGLAYSR